MDKVLIKSISCMDEFKKSQHAELVKRTIEYLNYGGDYWYSASTIITPAYMEDVTVVNWAYWSYSSSAGKHKWYLGGTNNSAGPVSFIYMIPGEQIPTPSPSPTPTPTPSPIPTPGATSMPPSDPTSDTSPKVTASPSPTPSEILDLSNKAVVNKRDDGVIETKLSESIIEEIDKELDEGGTVAIQMEQGDTGQSFEAPAALFTSVAEKQGTVTLDFGGLQLKMPGSAIDVEKISRGAGVEDVSALQVSLKVVEAPAEEFKPGTDVSAVSKVFQITFEVVTQDGESVQVTSFTIPIELKIPEEGERPGDYVEGTRNVYKIDVDPPQYCYTYFDGENYVAELTGLSEYAVLEYKGSFDDVAETHWALNYIRVLAAKGIVEGVGDNIFNTGRNVTRAEFAKMIAKALNLRLSEYKGTFVDVPGGSWYAPYVEAVAQAGIVQGVGNGKFDPDSTITREQMAVMVMRAYAYVTGESINTIARMYDGRFTDMDSASLWAKASIKAACVKGIVNDMTADTFEPAGFSRRDQSAAVIVRLLEAINKL